MPKNKSEVRSFNDATGTIRYTLMNDYMFRIVFQENKEALRGLVAALLHIDPEQIIDIEIRNTIKVGESISEKEYRMDLSIHLWDERNLDIELQVRDQGDWPDRSLLYLCRLYDSIARGEDNFASVQPAIQIGILDFTLFPNAPEFCASYKMMNVRSHNLYNDKFELKVLQLNQIKLATEEDKLYNLNEWARLFKAKTWEELKMVAQQNKYLNEAATSVFRYESDYSIRKRCQDREDALREEAAKNRKITLLQNEIAGLLNKNSNLQDENSNLQAENSSLQNEITELKKQLAEALNK